MSLSSLVFLSLFVLGCASRGTGPHIVTILSDDLGFFDSGLAGNPNVTTPNLDALIKSGIRLGHHYAYKYCSPSRRAFVTGRWPLHLDEMNQVADGIDLRMKTLGDKLSSVGYKTALIGKTHWGIATTYHLPYNRGWSSHLGYLGGGEAYWSGHECKTGDGTVNCATFTSELDMWHDDHPAEKHFIGQYSTDLFSQQAVTLIESHEFDKQPLWLHLNYQAVHNPQTSPPGAPTWANDGSKVFYEVLRRMDGGIGNVSAALKAKGVWDNTLILFMSDNGAAQLGNNFPLRGGKYSPWEGGVRVQSALFGGFLPSNLAGTTFQGLLHVSDWYPTLCSLAGADPTDNPKGTKDSEWFWPVDGFDVWPFITEGKSDPHGAVVLSSPVTSGPGGGAMLSGVYKIVYNSHNNGWDQPPDSQKSSPKKPGNQTCLPGSPNTRSCLVCSVERPCLYNVWEDESETKNLANQLPHVVKKLNATYTELVFKRRMPVPLVFTKNNGWTCSKSNKNENPWGVYLGPGCWCTASGGNCTLQPGPYAGL